MKTQTMIALLAACTLVACSEKRPPDPLSDAKSNLLRQYTLMDGSRVPLTQYDCSSPVRKAKNGESYAECYAQLKGYVHRDVYFCSTTPGGRCDSGRPEE